MQSAIDNTSEKSKVKSKGSKKQKKDVENHASKKLATVTVSKKVEVDVVLILTQLTQLKIFCF